MYNFVFFVYYAIFHPKQSHRNVFSKGIPSFAICDVLNMGKTLIISRQLTYFTGLFPN